MDISTLFLQRYDPLYNFYLAGFWEQVPYDLMRQRPHARTNSIAWNLWHITRVEDAGLNRFVADLPQVFTEGGWQEQINLPWKHHGTEMTFAEVDQLNKQINLDALHDYSLAVQARTRAILPTVDSQALDMGMEEHQLRKIMVNEGLAHSNAEGFIKNYLGWSKSKCLLTFGLTHTWQHLGEMEVIASLLEINFE